MPIYNMSHTGQELDAAIALQQNQFVVTNPASPQEVEQGKQYIDKVTGTVKTGTGTLLKEGWTRPSDWPDYSKVDLTNQEVCYLTFDTQHPDFPDGTTVGFYLQTSDSSPVNCAIGQLLDGDFIQERVVQLRSNSRTMVELPRNEQTRYVVFKMYPAGGSHITNWMFSGDPGSYKVHAYPCVERYARLPRVSAFSAYNSVWVVRAMVADTVIDKNVEGSPSASYGNIYVGGPSSNLQYLNLNGMNTRNVTDLRRCFNGLYNLREIHVEDWDVSSVTTLYGLFEDCFALQKVDLSSWNTSEALTSVGAMFKGCTSLRKADISGLNLSEVTSLGDMFSTCYALEEVNWGAHNLPKVTSLTNLFYMCAKLREIDMSNVELPNVTNLNTMCQGCRWLERLIAPHLSLKSGATISNAFNQQVPYLKEIVLGDIGVNFNISAASLLSRDSALRLIDSLVQTSTTLTLTLPSSVKALLTDEEIAVATSKGWTVA